MKDISIYPDKPIQILLDRPTVRLNDTRGLHAVACKWKEGTVRYRSTDKFTRATRGHVDLKKIAKVNRYISSCAIRSHGFSIQTIRSLGLQFVPSNKTKSVLPNCNSFPRFPFSRTEIRSLDFNIQKELFK